MFRLPSLLLLAGLLLAGWPPAAGAQDGCAWYGKRPLCDGQCPGGTVYTGQRESCLTGSRRYCCPSRYVTPGVNCKWVGRPGTMLYACDDTKPKDRPRAEQPWAAVAVDGRGGWGASVRLDGSPMTVGDALRRCGSACRIVAQGAGRCVAVAQSRAGGYWVGHAYGNSRDAVRDIALRGCTTRAPAGTCRLEHVNCL